MERLQFCDYHNMIAILEKDEYNSDFHPMVDFIAASPLRRNLKLRDEDGIVFIPDTELFENLTLMGYNISQNQKLTFHKGQFSHQWKYLIHTIMQCLSPKSIGFNEFSSNIGTALVCLATNRTYNFSKMIFDAMVKNVNNKISKFLMYLRQYSRRVRIAQSSALPTIADEPASLVRDVSEREACPTKSGFIADQDRATIAKTSTLPHDSAPKVTSHATDEGSMQHTISELTALCTSLQRQYSELLVKFQAQKEEIVRLKDRVQVLEDREGGAAKHSGDDSPIKGRSINEWRLQEQIEAQVARELEEQQEKENIRMNEQIARDVEVVRIHAEEEIQGMIDSLDKSNETIAKNNLGWKVKDFKGLSFEEIKAKFTEVRKQSKALSPDANEPASLARDDRHEEAFLTVSSLDAGQDRENIAKTSAILKARVKSLKDKERRREEPIQEDAPITGGIIDI
nr:glutamic acid-rich protein-like [Tanacetum cinerariifolium]